MTHIIKERIESSCIRDSRDYMVMMLVTVLQLPVEDKVIKKEEKLSQNDFFSQFVKSLQLIA